MNYFYKDNGLKTKYECIECKDGMLASYANGHYNTLCNIKNGFNLSKILFKGEVKLCNQIIANSIERDNGTSPNYLHCKCPNNYARVSMVSSQDKEPLMTCIGEDLISIIVDYKALDYKIDIYILFDEALYRLNNCEPRRKDNDMNERC
ncbi:MAG: hypothetical protein MHPSP_004670, partial [Paramarteilia canceri]